MSIQQTILQSFEIGKFTSVKVLSCDLRDIFTVEVNEFNVCLGSEFYQYLKDNLIVYNACAWNPTKNYVIGDLVTYNNIVYKALVDNINKEPLTCEAIWEAQPKFSSQCLNDLWEYYLGPYLSWQIIKSKLPFIATQLTSDGLIKRHGNNFSAADNNDFITIQKAAYKQSDMTFKNLDTFIRNNPTLPCVTKYKGLMPCKCDVCKCEIDKCSCSTDNSFGYEFA